MKMDLRKVILLVVVIASTHVSSLPPNNHHSTVAMFTKLEIAVDKLGRDQERTKELMMDIREYIRATNVNCLNKEESLKSQILKEISYINRNCQSATTTTITTTTTSPTTNETTTTTTTTTTDVPTTTTTTKAPTTTTVAPTTTTVAPTTTTVAPTTTTIRGNPRDCQEWLDFGVPNAVFAGVYTIEVESRHAEVYCTEEGWTVIQKRTDDTVDYNRSHVEYARGFGDVDGEHWLGLNTVHDLTARGNWTLRIELESFDNETASAEYSEFSIGAGPDFTLEFNPSSYQGTAGNSLAFGEHDTNHHGMKFTTYDKDQDLDHYDNCAERYSGGWWYNNCVYASTTGMPYHERDGGFKSIYWHMWKGHDRLKSVTLKIKRN